MKTLFLLLLFALTSLGVLPAWAQSVSYTPSQIERTARLAELYGHIKFFHPYLGYKPIDWDSAFAATAPRLAMAETDEETRAVLGQLLSALGDEATVVQRPTKLGTVLSSTKEDSIQVYFTGDSTLVLKANNYIGASDFETPIGKFGKFIDLLPKARAALLDLRTTRTLPERESEIFKYGMGYVGLERTFSTVPFVTAGERRRNHSGFASEGGGSNGYWSGFYSPSGQKIQSRQGARDLPLAVLVNRNSVLSPALLALRDLPNGHFYSIEPLSDAQLVSTVVFPFNDSISVQFRTGELVNPDGSLGVSGVDIIPAVAQPGLASKADNRTDAATAYVLDQLRMPKASKTDAPSLATPLPVAALSAKYPVNKYPALGYRLLAGAKIWAVIHYFHAYKDLMPTDWDKNLRTAIGELAAAADSMQYALAVAHFYRNIQDGHGFISNSALREYAGSGAVPIDIRFIENKPVVTRVFADSVAAKGIRPGDVILEVNGEKIADRITRMSAIQSASNEWTRLQYITYRLLRGPVGTPIRVKLSGADGKQKTVVLTSQPGNQLQPPTDTSAVFRLLPDNIGYVDMGRLQTSDVDRMFEAFKSTKAIIFDSRNYPNGTAWSIAPRLTDRKHVVAAKFFRYAPSEPDFPNGESNGSTQKYFFDQQIPPGEGKSVYKGKTVMLVDERTQSQAEHTGLFFEAANGTEFIGSPTAGANGDVTSFGIPGGISLTFSGHDVRHADGRPLQQVGLQPKILIRPTIIGIRTGKDEVLEKAVQYLNAGKSLSSSTK